MSKMNALRIINLNYNHHTMKIDDELFHLQGQSTLLSLRNGGGKSVLVQMMMAPFMTKGKRNLKDREFQSYFTTPKPTLILIEWVKDHGAGYVLTGMMVRKRQDQLEEMEKEPLEVLQFIHEYKEANPYDITHFPAVELTEKGKKLKAFGTMKQLFDSLKKDGKYHFNYYDMSQSHQARRYFSHLKENQIHQKEWESIIKPINLKESGLSELFHDCKNASGLVEKWFLHAVHDKLNKEDDKIKRFKDNLMKYIYQYKENASKINRKELIEAFKEAAKILFEEAYGFQENLAQKEILESQLVALSDQLTKCVEELRQALEKEEEKEQHIKESIERLQYEELCIKIYEKLQEEGGILDAIKVNETSAHKVQEEKETLQQEVYKRECTKLYSHYQKASREVQKYENDLENLQKESKDLAPLRQDLGYTLKTYYKQKESELTRWQDQVVGKMLNNHQEKQMLEEKESHLRTQSSQLEQDKGRLEERVYAYEKEEAAYNTKYEEALTRNIVGEYTEQLFYEKKKELKQEEEHTVRRSSQSKHRLQAIEEESEGCVRQERALERKIIQEAAERERYEKEREKLEKELVVRRESIKYIGLSEEKVFDQEAILEGFDSYIEKMRDKERTYLLAYDKEMEAYHALKSGSVLKLSQELEEAIAGLGINIVYGMEWLKKNGHTEEENTKLVRANPFIPYALIMPEKEMMRLGQHTLSLYTEVPIPIISREKLESYSEGIVSPQVHTFEGVSFLVAFNEQLLNEQDLIVLVAQKEKQLKGMEEALEKRREEIKFYEEKRHRIAHGILSKAYYERTLEHIERLTASQQEQKKEKDQLVKQLQQLQEEKKACTVQLEQYRRTLEKLQSQYQALKALEAAYEVYTEARGSLQSVKEKLERGKEEAIELLQRRKELYERGEALAKEQLDVTMKLNGVREKLLGYESYKEGKLIEKDIEDIEAQYRSITEQISMGQKAIERQLQQARERFKDAQDDLIEKAKEYKLEERDYIYLSYSRLEEKQFKDDIKEREVQLKALQREFADLRELKGKIEQDREMLTNRLEDKFHKPLKDQEELVKVDFAKHIYDYRVQLDTVLKQKKCYEEEQRIFEMHRISLNEFEQMACKEKVEIIFDVKTVERIKGELIRDYRMCMEESRKCHHRLGKAVESMQRKELFQDEFFNKPLKTLMKLVDQPSTVIENLNNTLGAYNNLMIKLEADIALIEKEKQSVLDSFIQYVFEIHEHIGRIDKNATVTIMDKPIKMLKVELPKWEEQEAIYEVRLRDYIDSITQEALEKLEQNEAVEELISKRITTKHLYNEVVGIAQIEIKLYKVEEEKVYQIAWDEVAKNSGGEGFLSAFVVLSSLLSYMRRDDHDLWGDKESGKVLVMDNPFAQTNAAHLLKPLMDMANKRNTQLICLSGLNGESIYNRFDNIYVLNLIESRLQEGTRYLKSEHLRGDERVETLVGVQIQTEESDQMTLF